ncbi:MAG: hypothetical protein QG564_1827 [Campylobacterota bacterium]|nr:hypothetical protein [Campylobacterota bacterium]
MNTEISFEINQNSIDLYVNEVNSLNFEINQNNIDVKTETNNIDLVTQENTIDLKIDNAIDNLTIINNNTGGYGQLSGSVLNNDSIIIDEQINTTTFLKYGIVLKNGGHFKNYELSIVNANGLFNYQIFGVFGNIGNIQIDIIEVNSVIQIVINNNSGFDLTINGYKIII